ncbi:AraC family transcriptional regulator [Roseovarius spongiae]|uniref:AraC family transcriptional regulator n=1 Tax=Roseovarius spongiae TaxID=2320272 RepID=UPI003CCC85EC
MCRNCGSRRRGACWNARRCRICWAVGYADASTFSRLFRSICGVSASEYRRRFAIA